MKHSPGSSKPCVLWLHRCSCLTSDFKAAIRWRTNLIIIETDFLICSFAPAAAASHCSFVRRRQLIPCRTEGARFLVLPSLIQFCKSLVKLNRFLTLLYFACRCVYADGYLFKKRELYSIYSRAYFLIIIISNRPNIR